MEELYMKTMKKFFWASLIAISGFGFGLVSCVDDPDGENLYTSTGETIEGLLTQDSTLTSFTYILQRANLLRTMASYGQYTVYAPSNEGIATYVDSLWNDQDAVIEHNGMTNNSLEGLTDSLCIDIAKYHIANGLYSIIEMGGAGTTISTMLGRPISTTVDSLGRTVLNGVSVITSEDNEVVNGIVHKITKVVPRTTRLLGDTFEHLDDYTIFNQALHMTGLADSVARSDKGKTWELMPDHSDTDGSLLYQPTSCPIGYTIFAESDAVFANYGINNIDDLIAYANKIYQNAPTWYDYMNEKGLTVSTGNDYTNRFNALNMFVAYHILYASMAQDQLVFENPSGVSTAVSKWNYVNGGEPYDYYETMLPNTLLKIWEPQPGKSLYINRYRTFNTLTNEVGTMGTNHEVKQAGVSIVREDIMAYNGYIHPIRSILVYNATVPNGVLNERLRFETTTYLEEFINTGIRYKSMSEMSILNGGGSGARVAFPTDFFDDVVVYNTTSNLRYNVKGDYRAYQADAFQGWNNYDIAIKIPPVPTGTYEFRLFYSPMGHGGMMQFYLGTSTNVQSMQALSIPLDVRIDEEDPRIGWTPFYEEDDRGIATDLAMRSRGYMRAPFGFRGHPGTGGDELTSSNCRGDGVVTLRRILGTLQFKQSDDHWFRIKSVISDETDLKWQVDFIELVPISVVNNDQYSEDWF